MSDTVQGNRSAGRRWVDHVIATTPQICLKRFSRNNSLIVNLGHVFDYLCQTLRVLCDYEHCLHAFVNRAMPEAHVLPSASAERRFERLPLSGERYEAIKRLTRWPERDGVHLDYPKFLILSPEELVEVTGLLGVQMPPAMEEGGLLIPFDFADLNLGMFVLWGRRTMARERRSPESEQVRGWAASTYFFLKEFFEREYAMVSRVTYLPSFYAARWAQAAILVADIKNFTPLTQIVRVMRTSRGEEAGTGVLRGILNEHCREMANIIQTDGRGRIDRFFGAGVMAIFGEHEVNPVKAAVTAVCVAAQMARRFQALKSQFLKEAFGASYATDYNESVSIELGVGIDFGTVLFDYLGDDEHREYTVIGDHVNFARRLEYEALRMDESGRLRPPILISPTVERCIRPWVRHSSACIIREKEMDYTCTAYGIFPDDFDEERYRFSLGSGDWQSPWGEIGAAPP